MVLDHVAERAGLVVIIAAALEPDRLRDGDLDVVDVGAVPQRLEQRIGEAQREQVLDRFLAEIMVDPEGAVLGERRRHRIIDFAARFEVAAERLLERHAHGRAGQARPRQPVDRRLEQRWRGRQEDGDAVARIADRPGQPLEAAGIVDVERNIMEPAEEPLRNPRLIETRRQMFLQRRVGAVAERILVEIGPRRSDDPQVVRQKPIRVQPVERWKEHAPGEVAGRAEHQESGHLLDHACLLQRGGALRKGRRNARTL